MNTCLFWFPNTCGSREGACFYFPSHSLCLGECLAHVGLGLYLLTTSMSKWWQRVAFIPLGLVEDWWFLKRSMQRQPGLSSLPASFCNIPLHFNVHKRFTWTTAVQPAASRVYGKSQSPGILAGSLINEPVLLELWSAVAMGTTAGLGEPRRLRREAENLGDSNVPWSA